jgi:hypothetical protein
MTNKEYLNIYKKYKSLLVTTVSDIVSFEESAIPGGKSFECLRERLKRAYLLLISEFKDVDFYKFTEKELLELDFKWFDDNLICMPTWALDCLKEGTEIRSINDRKIIIKKGDKLSKDTRSGVSAYGFNKSQLRDSKLNSILDEQL